MVGRRTGEERFSCCGGQNKPRPAKTRRFLQLALVSQCSRFGRKKAEPRQFAAQSSKGRGRLQNRDQFAADDIRKPSTRSTGPEWNKFDTGCVE
jgi:hypothetical protein